MSASPQEAKTPPAKTPQQWKGQTPKPFDILHAYFPYVETPGDPGPVCHFVLVLAVKPGTDPLEILVAYGTSQDTDNLDPWEFVVPPAGNKVAKKAANLDKDTKFNLNRTATLLYNRCWFKPVAGRATPRIGCLDPSAQAPFRLARIEVERLLGGSLIPGKPPLSVSAPAAPPVAPATGDESSNDTANATN